MGEPAQRSATRRRTARARGRRIGAVRELGARFADRQQQVGPLEVLADVAAYTSHPEQMRGRDVLHFINNTGALFGLSQSPRELTPLKA